MATTNIYESVNSVIILIIALSVGPVADLTRIVRRELVESLDSEYLLLVRTKVLNKRLAVLRHELRNSMVFVLTKIISILFLFLVVPSLLK